MSPALPAVRYSDFSFTLPDSPGSLAAFASRLRAADVNLIGLWGYGDPTASSDGPARFYCVPENADQFRNFAASADLEWEEGTTFFIRGDDQPGSLSQTLESIGSSAINLIAIQAVVVGRDFGCFAWAAPEDWAALSDLLGC